MNVVEKQPSPVGRSRCTIAAAIPVTCIEAAHVDYTDPGYVSTWGKARDPRVMLRLC